MGTPTEIERDAGGKTYQCIVNTDGDLIFQNTTDPKVYFRIDVDASLEMLLNVNLRMNDAAESEITGCSTVTLPNTAHTALGDYGATELVRKDHI